MIKSSYQNQKEKACYGKKILKSGHTSVGPVGIIKEDIHIH